MSKELIGGAAFLVMLMLAATVPAAVLSGHPVWHGVVATLAIIVFAMAFGIAATLVIIGILKIGRRGG